MHTATRYHQLQRKILDSTSSLMFSIVRFASSPSYGRALATAHDTTWTMLLMISNQDFKGAWT
jgi:hypothetical protein